MSGTADCVFCRIVAGSIPSNVIYQDEHVFAFLDVGPLAEGHVLLIPRAHVERLADLPAETCVALGSATPKLAQAVVKATGAEGLNVLANQGAAAGQVVPHVHYHLIPRRAGDGLGYRWNAGAYSSGRAVEVAAMIRDAL